VIVPIREWDLLAHKGLRFVLKMSPLIYAVQVVRDEQAEDLQARWVNFVEQPTTAAGLPTPKLVVLQSPYRRLISPLLRFLDQIKAEYPDRQIAVIIPELVEHRWYHYPLHNQRAALLKAWLLFSGDRRVVVINVPWYLTQ